MHLNYQKVTEEIFSNWIDDLVKRVSGALEQCLCSTFLKFAFQDVRLPLYQPYKDRREALFQLRINNDGKWPTDTPKQHKIPRQPPPTFVQTFGADILSCMVNPWHLIHLQLLGPRDFEKVAIGLYVRCKVNSLLFFLLKMDRRVGESVGAEMCRRIQLLSPPPPRNFFYIC